MVRADTLRLIQEEPAAHGVFDDVQESTREVFCTVRSVSQTEIYQARATGLAPELRLRLEHTCEYQGEKKCVFRGVPYDIIRTYMDEKDGIELTIQRTEGNAYVQPAAEQAESD